MPQVDNEGNVFPVTLADVLHPSSDQLGFFCIEGEMEGKWNVIFDQHSQPEYASIEMIRMPHVHSNISMTAKLGGYQ